MAESLSQVIANAYHRTHVHAMEVVVDLSQEQLIQPASKNVPPIWWHLWHMARWADFLQEVLTEPGNQLWIKGRVAEAWGLSQSELGYAQTGFGMDGSLAASLRLPMDSVFDYVRSAFAGAEQAITSLDDSRLLSMYNGPRAAEYYQGEQTLAYIVLRSIRHESRHVGNIESLRGAKFNRGLFIRHNSLRGFYWR